MWPRLIKMSLVDYFQEIKLVISSLNFLFLRVNKKLQSDIMMFIFCNVFVFFNSLPLTRKLKTGRFWSHPIKCPMLTFPSLFLCHVLLPSFTSTIKYKTLREAIQQSRYSWCHKICTSYSCTLKMETDVADSLTTPMIIHPKRL